MLKVELRITVNGQPLAIQAEVQGEGEAAQRAAAEISAALASILTSLAQQPSPAPTATSLNPAAGPAEAIPAPDAAAQPAAPSAVAGQMDGALTPQKHPLVLLMQRHRVRINVGFGGLLLALAVLAPIVAPADQRREMLIVTLLLGLTAALMLSTAMLPGPGGPATPTRPRQDRAERMSREQARAVLLARSRAPLSAGWGLLLGAVFLLLGVLAPFTLGATTADERFVIMIGFSPIAVIGGLLVYIFWRRAFSVPQPQQPTRAVAGGPGRQPSVARVPQTAGYKSVLPALLLGLAVFVAAVVIAVIYGTVSAALR